MKEYIEEGAIDIANYIIENNSTVRQTAKQFGISKSTVHKDVTERLMQIHPWGVSYQGEIFTRIKKRADYFVIRPSIIACLIHNCKESIVDDI